MRIGIDVGGTFTDIVATDDSTGEFQYTKTLTTYPNIWEGVLDGITRILDKTGCTMDQVNYIVHGTTIGTNALIEKKGAKTGLITTEGFVDVLEIGRCMRPYNALYDFFVDNPPPLVPRYLRKGVLERVSAEGEVLRPLDEEKVREALHYFKQHNVESVAVCLLFSFQNPAHEMRIAEICTEEFPEAYISLSSEIAPEFREFERSSTTVINAYLQPVMKRYISQLTKELEKKYGKVDLRIMQASGGTITAEAAEKFAINTVNSGPAGGVLAGAFVGHIIDRKKLISVDMGGTSFDIGLIDGGIPKITSEANFDGYPIKIPVIDIDAIGAGGGSIAWIDKGGVLNVGPQSAGASPGPACYNKGGKLPAVTDANLVLGRLSDNYFLGGEMVLCKDLATQAIKEHVADPLGITVEAAAAGIIRIINAKMSKGISVNSVEKGSDVREFSLVAFGGAGPLHAVELAAEMEMQAVIVPPICGGFSAVGLLVSDVRYDFVRTMIRSFSDIDLDQINKIFKELEQKGIAQLTFESFNPQDMELVWSVDLRYEGQAYELNILADRDENLGKKDMEKIIKQFHALHEKLYAYSSQEEEVQFVNLRVTAIGKTPPVEFKAKSLTGRNGTEGLKDSRPVYFEGHGFIDTPIYERDYLLSGSLFTGPAIVEETISSTLVTPESKCFVDEFGNLILTWGGSIMTKKTDFITMQVIRYAMEQIADEMGHTLIRAARSTVIKEIGDISCAVFDHKGRTIAQAHHAPMLLTGLGITMSRLIQEYPPGTLQDGDIIISNDPYMGGQHIMDVQMFAPVFFKGELVGYVGTIAHMVDMGGSSPGGVAGGLNEIYLEGLRLPMVKLYKAYKEDKEIFGILRNNIRVPQVTLGDVRAMASGNYVGVERLQDVFAKYGVEIVQDVTAMLMDYSERRMREGLQVIPDGTYIGVDYIDDDGVSDDPIKIQVNINKKGDCIKVNFDGTGKQVKGNINCPIATVYAAVYYTIICVIDSSVAANSGCYRPIELDIEEGLIVNPRMPGAVASRTNTSQKIVEAMVKALSVALPERVVAGSHGQISTCAFSSYDKKGNRFVYTDIQGGGAGARPTKDAREGQDSHLARFMNTPVEAAEMEFPVRVECYEFIPDTGGPGKFRGGLSMRKDTRFLCENVSFARYGDRQKFRPFGLFGGKGGAMGRFILNPGTSGEKQMRSKGLNTLQYNDVISLQLPGGGGYGNPLERDPELVKQDVLDGKISLATAKDIYGVILSTSDLAIEQQKTDEQRQQLGID